MDSTKMELRAALKKYVQNTQEVRALSTVNVTKLKGSRDYAETLRDNFIRIRTINVENRAILADVLDPVLKSREQLTDEQVQILREFRQELIDSRTVEYLDLPIMAKVVARLYQDANDKGELSYLIEQLDAQLEEYYALSCYAARLTTNQKIAMEYVRRGEPASRRFHELIQKDEFSRIEEDDIKDIVLVNYRYRTSIYEGICNNEEINARVIAEYRDSIAILDDPFFHEVMKDYNWDYYELRVLEYISMVTEGGNRRGFSREQLQFIYECSERLANKWETNREFYEKYIKESEKRQFTARNRYLTGRLGKAEYKKELLEIYRARNESGFVVSDIYDNILVPIEYLCVVKGDDISEKERRILLDFYRKLVAYAHNVKNTGELTAILNYYFVFLENFIEVSDEFTMEEMCLKSFAALHPPTYIHSNMVALLSRCLCRHLLKKKPWLFIGVLGYSDEEQVIRHKRDILERIYHGALVHDVGKLAIIDTIFVYGRNITDEEFQLIQLHPEAGYHLAAKGTALATYKDFILWHHRSYDGKSGYPHMEGFVPLPDKILIDIVALADSMDAATDTVGRSYTQGKTLEQLIQELVDGSGTRYSPDVVKLITDPVVRRDLEFLLTEGREKIYSDTYLLLKNVQVHGGNLEREEDLIEQFRAFMKRMAKYQTAAELLYFDLETAAPHKGLAAKADTLAMLSVEMKEYLTSVEAEQMFRKLSKIQIEDEGLRKSYELLSEDIAKIRRIPNDFYEEFVRERALSNKAWERAKEENDFSIFAPHLEKMISMTKQQCAYTDPGRDVYDVLLDEYEKGMDQGTIDELFGTLKEGLVKLLHRIEEKPAFDASVLSGDYDIGAQREVSKLLLDYIGFDMEAGALAESVHPFTIRISTGDVRVTNSYRADEAINAMFSAIHEGGHALFEQGIDEKYINTQVENVRWMGLHESQSRFYENILGRNIAFWKPIYAKVQEYLPKFREIDLDTFERAINDVHRSLIRTDADEVTYGLHIILRYEMELAIFRDNVPVSKLPDLWRQKSKELLGIEPKTDAEGILQDMHWSDASFGYFPSYLLGSIYGGMLLAAMKKELGDVDAILERGEIQKITAWLKEKIFRHGNMYTSRELIPAICGKEITADDLLEYFNEKYSRVYRLE